MIPPAAASSSAAPAAAGAKWWGGGSGVTRTEVLHGLPVGGVDLALANGKKHVPLPSYEARSRAVVLHGLPLTGRGSDLAAQGGRQKIAPPPPPVRSKIEALNGLPMSGRDADIALAGGRQHFPGMATARSGSAPPKACNETVRDMQLSDSREACGRSPAKKDRAPLQAASRRATWNPSSSPRARSADGGVASPCAGGGAASPCRGGAASPRAGSGAGSPCARGGAASPRSGGSPRAGANRRLSGAGKVCSPGGQQSRRKLSGGGQQPRICEDGLCVDACDDDRFGACAVERALDCALNAKGCSSLSDSRKFGREVFPAQEPSLAGLTSPGSLTSSASLASLTSELSQCLNLNNSVKSVARTCSTASLISPENASAQPGSALNSAVEDVLRGKMETAWQAICTKLRIPYEAPPPQVRRATQTAGRPSPMVKSPSMKAHPFRSTTNGGNLSAR